MMSLLADLKEKLADAADSLAGQLLDIEATQAILEREQQIARNIQSHMADIKRAIAALEDIETPRSAAGGQGKDSQQEAPDQPETPIPEGFVAWGGGEWTGDPDARVEVIFRNGSRNAENIAAEWVWEHTKGWSEAFHVIAYRILPPTETADETPDLATEIETHFQQGLAAEGWVPVDEFEFPKSEAIVECRWDDAFCETFEFVGYTPTTNEPHWRSTRYESTEADQVITHYRSFAKAEQPQGPSPVEDEWLDIADAPHDGTRVQLKRDRDDNVKLMWLMPCHYESYGWHAQPEANQKSLRIPYAPTHYRLFPEDLAKPADGPSSQELQHEQTPSETNNQQEDSLKGDEIVSFEDGGERIDYVYYNGTLTITAIDPAKPAPNSSGDLETAAPGGETNKLGWRETEGWAEACATPIPGVEIMAVEIISPRLEQSNDAIMQRQDDIDASEPVGETV
jgi:hypothetical protein